MKCMGLCEYMKHVTTDQTIFSRLIIATLSISKAMATSTVQYMHVLDAPVARERPLQRDNVHVQFQTYYGLRTGGQTDML